MEKSWEEAYLNNYRKTGLIHSKEYSYYDALINAGANEQDVKDIFDKNIDLELRCQKLLNLLGIYSNRKGFKYITEYILVFKGNDCFNVILESGYKLVAEKYKVKRINVYSSIITSVKAISNSFDNGFAAAIFKDFDFHNQKGSIPAKKILITLLDVLK